ncbi:MAG: hypothetical protein JXB38_15845 [Anaerolineales bacterium]|nr:hypothetical protein [Anaerolineales bacterium]
MTQVTQSNRATKLIASTFGVLVGLAGINHGVFEMLQGNTVPDGVMIAAIGPAQRFWEYGMETALTLIPNFLVTGILSVVVGILVVIWAGWFLHKRYAAGVLLLLSIALFLVGGGFAPIFMMLLASLTASRIHRPLKLWRTLLSGVVRRFFAKLWPGVLVVFVVVFVISVVIAIFGWPLMVFLDAETAFKLLNTIAYGMLVLMLLSVIAGFASDIHAADKQIKKGWSDDH